MTTKRIFKPMATILFFYKEGSKDCERVRGVLDDFVREYPKHLVLRLNVYDDGCLSAIDRHNVCMVPTVVIVESGKRICGRNISKEMLSKNLV